MDQLATQLAGKLVIAHNASFDTNVIVRSCFRYGIDIPDANTACTVALARKAWPGLPAYRLNVVAEYLGIDLIHHDAESDAHACAQIALAGHSNGTGLDAVRQTPLATIAERAIQRDQQRRRSIF
jgi:DNA polymerase-3 subunit epsilon